MFGFLLQGKPPDVEMRASEFTFSDGSSVFWCEHPGICGPSYWARAVFPGIRTYPRKIPSDLCFVHWFLNQLRVEESSLRSCLGYYLDLETGVETVPFALLNQVCVAILYMPAYFVCIPDHLREFS